MCRMQGSGTAPTPSPFGFWPALQHQQQYQHQHQQQHRDRPHHRQAADRRRYKYETKLGKGQHGGIMYKARCDRGKLWAIEVISDPAKSTAATALAKQYQLTQDEPWMQPTLAALAAQQAAGKNVDLCVPEEMYTDHKGAWCIVSKLPKESMRQRIMSDASYGLESVVNWARQLASSLAGVPKQEREVVSLDNVFLDDADCVLVGNFLPSTCYTPSTASSEEEEVEEEGGEEEHDEDEEEEEEQQRQQQQRQQEAEEQQRQQQQQQQKKQQKQSKKGQKGKVSKFSIKMEEPDEGQRPQLLRASSASPFTTAQAEHQRQQPPRGKSWSAASSSSSSNKGTATATAAAAALSREEELKRWGVLMYQVATKTILHGDVDTARRQILRSAQAGMEGGSERASKQALLDLLHRQLGISGAGSNGGTGTAAAAGATLTLVGGKVAPAGGSLESLANAIADAVLGEERKKKDVAAAAAAARALARPQHQMAIEVPEPISTKFRSSSPSPSSLPTVALPARVPFPFPFTHQLQQQQQQPQSNATRSILAALQQTRDTKMRQRAFVALGKLGPKAAVPEVVHALMSILEKDPDPVSRRLAAWTLGSMGNGSPSKVAQAAMPLIRALGDEEAAVRAAAAWALGNLGKVCEERGALATLLHRSVKDADPQVREMALKSLARVGKVTGKRRRTGREEDGGEGGGGGGKEEGGWKGEGGLTSGGRPKAYAKRRPFCLASATLSMEMASISGGRGGMGGLMRESPTAVGIHHFNFGASSSSNGSSSSSSSSSGFGGSQAAGENSSSSSSSSSGVSVKMEAPTMMMMQQAQRS